MRIGVRKGCVDESNASVGGCIEDGYECRDLRGSAEQKYELARIRKQTAKIKLQSTMVKMHRWMITERTWMVNGQIWMITEQTQMLLFES